MFLVFMFFFILSFFISILFFFFFFNDTATTEIYTLSLHDALPIGPWARHALPPRNPPVIVRRSDRKSTRLNSSHMSISYAVFCLKKKKKNKRPYKIKKKKKSHIYHYK